MDGTTADDAAPHTVGPTATLLWELEAEGHENVADYLKRFPLDAIDLIEC